MRGDVLERSAPARGPLVPVVLRAPAATLATLVLVIWALTSGAYFWPAWVWLGIAYVIALVASIRFANSIGHRGARRFTLVALIASVLSLGEIPQWALSGFGYFWPVWALLGSVLLIGGYWIVARPSRAELEQRVDELSRTRRGALDVQASELRRIERDLHDGAQARLVALSMKLGRAEDRYAEQPEVSALLREAREDASAAIRELRELARGIAPPVLADRGLEAAVRSLTDRTGMEVEVRASLSRRPTPAVETAAYFVVAEALTNAAKHAAGARAEVRIDEQSGDLFVEVTDFGPGGADPSGGGLTGLRQRVEALDGRLQVTSPDGVGTQVEAMLPCGW
ncbi:MAG TPA: histidine kinase [Solirubrobacteraceae bacterium]|nr:histidine kinase [Solirubrobacteraceae bacterium]